MSIRYNNEDIISLYYPGFIDPFKYDNLLQGIRERFRNPILMSEIVSTRGYKLIGDFSNEIMQVRDEILRFLEPHEIPEEHNKIVYLSKGAPILPPFWLLRTVIRKRYTIIPLKYTDKYYIAKEEKQLNTTKTYFRLLQDKFYILFAENEVILVADKEDPKFSHILLNYILS